ncbi:MAG: aspartyl protease family protein [Acidobacteriota bacterium]
MANHHKTRLSRVRVIRVVTLALAGAAFLCGSTNLPAQQKQSRGARKPASNARFETGRPVLNIPFDFEYRQIVLKVSVNGSAPMKFGFDTGAGATILSQSKTAGLKLKKIDTVKVNGVVAGILAGGVTLSVPGVTVLNQRVVIIPLDGFPCEVLDLVGFIGYDFIKEFVVEIDYEARTLSLYDPSTYQYAGSGEVIPLTISETPKVQAGIILPGKDPIYGFFEIDTGSDSALSINSAMVKRHGLLAGSGTQMASSNTRVHGELKAVDVRLGGFQLGRSAIARPIVSLLPDEESDNDGPIGNEILRRFKVTIDYSRQRMMLEPNNHLSDPFETDMSGIEFESSGENCRVFKVVGVTEKSPAEETGVLIGDEIVAIDNKPANQFTSGQIEKMFMEAEQERSVTLRRDGKERIVKIMLRRPL